MKESMSLLQIYAFSMNYKNLYQIIFNKNQTLNSFFSLLLYLYNHVA